jgi:beta-galactosidase
VDFGTTSNPQDCFNIQRGAEPQGPYIDSEFYTGWLDHWSETHETVDTSAVTSTLSAILALNASVSMYMYHGGTNFNFTGGANGDNLADLEPDPTSYDYDAPLNEAGDPTDKYYAIRDTIAQYMEVPNGTLPQPSAKLSFGPVSLTSAGTVFDLISTLAYGDPVASDTPLNFEELSLGYGYVLYQTTLTDSYDSVPLSIPGLSDRGYVYVDGELIDILERSNGVTSTTISGDSGQTLSIIVENQGRVNFGVGLTDFKGLRHEVSLDGSDVTQTWNHYLLPFNNTNMIQTTSTSCDLPAVFTGTFVLDNSTLLDTFLDPTGWGKGVAVLNDVILGRYWPTEGPQVTLYVPSVYLNAPPASNTLVMIEFEQSNCQDGGATVTFTDTPYINKPVSTSQEAARFRRHL